jgi:hypothetical protein
MRFNASEMREQALPQKGRYHFSVLHTREKTSAAGNDMFIFKMRLTKDNKSFNFFVALVLMPKMFWQFEHFCQATGIPHKIDEGDLMAQECDGLEGFLEMDHRANPQTGEIEAYVKDFVKPENLDPVDRNDAHFFDDDIPPLA